ncbi:alpha/beta hydrolase [Mycobacterium sp. E796]|uniref:alpha/beta hydrolase n=1 Tax=Mycobacterium sp. E796 TaxID=1834151 RepID=UPI0009EF01E8|nr:alpha/beta hydrolase [Mycobacterium sp. E796]
MGGAVSQRDDFHPDLRRFARVLPRGAFNRRTLPIMKALTRPMAFLPPPKGAKVLTLPSGAGVRLHRPATKRHAGAALLWIHGGGYVIGTAAQDDSLCQRFVQRLGIPVAAVEYRLAPKHPYPAALEDCYDVLIWLSRLPGIDPARIIVGGASAGGGLTAALALLARDRGEVSPLFQLLVYPMVDDCSSDRVADNPRYRMWTPNTNRLGWQAYLGSADPQVAVPARHTNLSGVPPAWVGVGTLDPLHDEDVEYARRLVDAGVACEVDTIPGAFHGFDMVTPWAGVSRAFFDRQCDVLQKVLTG